MNDRIPAEGKAGRMLITPENGSAPFYATVTMADEPLDEGTPLIKANLLKDATAALLGGNNSMVPDEALVALKSMIDAVDAACVKSEAGSYVGTGTTGEDGKCTLTFGFVPKLVFVTKLTTTNTITSTNSTLTTVFVYGDTAALVSYGSMLQENTVVWSGTSVSWHAERNASPEKQLNESGATYLYIALG